MGFKVEFRAIEKCGEGTLRMTGSQKLILKGSLQGHPMPLNGFIKRFMDENRPCPASLVAPGWSSSILGQMAENDFSTFSENLNGN